MRRNIKLLERLRNRTEARRSAVISLLISFGFDQREGGKHTVFTYQDIMIPIPHERRLGRPYVRIVVKRLDEIISSERESKDVGD